MKKSAVLVAAILALPVVANEFKKPEGSFPVASPNRMPSQALVHRHGHHGGKKARPGETSSGAILWATADGKTLGRWLGNDTVLVSHEGHATAIRGLGPALDCTGYTPSGNSTYCRPVGGYTWSGGTETIFYAQGECTGGMYMMPAGSSATARTGLVMEDGGAHYVYIVNPAQARLLPMPSFFQNGVCQTVNYKAPSFLVAPVLSVVPAATFGTGPFFLQ